MALIIQRRLQRGNMTWTDWEDVELPYTPPVPVELREKPPFVPGWYFRRIDSDRFELWYCCHDTPPIFPKQWLPVEEDFLDKNLGFGDVGYDD